MLLRLYDPSLPVWETSGHLMCHYPVETIGGPQWLLFIKIYIGSLYALQRSVVKVDLMSFYPLQDQFCHLGTVKDETFCYSVIIKHELNIVGCRYNKKVQCTIKTYYIYIFYKKCTRTICFNLLTAKNTS